MQQSTRDSSRCPGEGNLFDEAGLAEGGCPNCGTAMKPTAVLCVECGFNRESGERLNGVRAKSTGHAGAADELLAKAEEALENTPVKHEGAYGGKAQEWGLLGLMAGIAIAIVFGFYLFFQTMEKRHEEAEELPSLGAIVLPHSTARV